MSSQDNSYSSANEEIVRSLDAIKARAEAATGGRGYKATRGVS